MIRKGLCPHLRLLNIGHDYQEPRRLHRKFVESGELKEVQHRPNAKMDIVRISAGSTAGLFEGVRARDAEHNGEDFLNWGLSRISSEDTRRFQGTLKIFEGPLLKEQSIHRVTQIPMIANLRVVKQVIRLVK